MTGSAAAEASERVTGKTLDEWDEAFQKRRVRGYEQRDFYGGRIVFIGSTEARNPNQPEVMAYARRYGLWEEDDLIAVRMRTRDILKKRTDYIVPVREGQLSEWDVVLIVNPEKYP